MPTMTTTTDNKLKDVANIYELPLLLQVPDHYVEAEWVGVGRPFRVESITFTKDYITFTSDTSSDYRACINKNWTGVMRLSQDKTLLTLEGWSSDKGEVYADYTIRIALVPVYPTYPNILEELEKVKEENAL